MSHVISFNNFNSNSSNNNNAAVRQAVRREGKRESLFGNRDAAGFVKRSQNSLFERRAEASEKGSVGGAEVHAEKMFDETSGCNLASSKSRLLSRNGSVRRPGWVPTTHQNHLQLGEKQVIKRKCSRSTTEQMCGTTVRI